MSYPPRPRTSPEPQPVPEARWIELSTGKFVLVDADDYGALSTYTWCQSHGYAYRRVSRGRTIRMHQGLLRVPKGYVVDHLNGDVLDNRRQNLRVATVSQNVANQKLKATNQSGYRGVSRYPSTGRWQVHLWCKKVHHFLGRYDDAVVAARAYDAAARKLFGEFARLNFPEEFEQGVQV